MSQQKLIAASIFLGFIMVALAIVFSGHFSNAKVSPTSPMRPAKVAYTYGSEKAPTTIVEFSDFECPFCSTLHPTLKKLVDESNGTINWQFRHLPLPIHAHARLAAEIGECVGTEVGNEAFWQYATTVLENNRNLSPDYLKSVAIDTDFSASALEACLADPLITEQIDDDMAVASAFGGRGTPFSVVVFPDGATKPVSGALPYEQWVNILKIQE